MLRITLAQLNPIVGAIGHNVQRVIDVCHEAARDQSDLVVFSELIVTGYPPKDLVERPGFIEQAQQGLNRIVEASKEIPGVGIVVGCPRVTGMQEGKPLYNTAILIADGAIVHEQAKMLLPTYDVFDEARYFRRGADNRPAEFKGRRIGLSICEDLWFEPDPWNRRPYALDPIELLAEQNVDLLVNISASPFSVGKESARYKLIRNHTRAHGVPFVFVNEVGGNDDLVFDGRSMYVDDKGSPRCVMPAFEESIKTIDSDGTEVIEPYEFEDDLQTVFKALVLGTRDYVTKCGFAKVVIGLSGGVDSAVTAALAVHALGEENVFGILMPSPFSSTGSVEDAQELARNLGIRVSVVPIHEPMAAYDAALKESFAGTEPDVTEENIQARIRGNIIMAFSNKFGCLPLSTGNKSELSVGYCTLYGDMSGGLAVISDVPKTLVYALADFMNRDRVIIPKNTIKKAPSAELRHEQKDQDTLPPYDILDPILERYIDRYESLDTIVEAGFDRDTARWVIDAVRQNEYKRKQAAPGLKVTSKAFGTGRRVPIAARYDA